MSESVIDLCTYGKNKLLRCWAVMELLRTDLILHKEEKDLSAVAWYGLQGHIIFNHCGYR